MDAQRGHGHHIQRLSLCITAEELLCFSQALLTHGDGTPVNAAQLLKRHLHKGEPESEDVLNCCMKRLHAAIGTTDQGE